MQQLNFDHMKVQSFCRDPEIFGMARDSLVGLKLHRFNMFFRKPVQCRYLYHYSNMFYFLSTTWFESRDCIWRWEKRSWLLSTNQRTARTGWRIKTTWIRLQISATSCVLNGQRLFWSSSKTSDKKLHILHNMLQ